MCTEIQNPVVMCQGGPWITGVSLWMKGMVIHRGGYLQFSGLVINCPQRHLFTGLNPQKSRRMSKSRARKNRSREESARHWAKISEKERTDRPERPVCGQRKGLFTDTEAGKDPSQQIIGAERAGDLTQRLLRLPQIFSQQFTSTR